MEILVQVLKQNTQAKILKACLGAIDNILEAGDEIRMGPTIDENPFYVKLLECNGMVEIERLQSYANTSVYKLVEKILKRTENSL